MFYDSDYVTFRGKLHIGINDPEWQEYFKTLKSEICQSDKRRLSYKETKNETEGFSQVFGYGYIGDSQRKRYCNFVNSVLATLRSGKDDHCFFVYQVAELLRFEHDRLRCEYKPDQSCFRVWLDKVN